MFIKQSHSFSDAIENTMDMEQPDGMTGPEVAKLFKKISSNILMKFRVYCRTRRYQRNGLRMVNWNIPEEFSKWYFSLGKSEHNYLLMGQNYHNAR
jgi:hypothetical protein